MSLRRRSYVENTRLEKMSHRILFEMSPHFVYTTVTHIDRETIQNESSNIV
jgi:hypothetical protein